MQLHHILKKYWGYDHFRPLQHEIASNVVAGHDTLGLMPTGGGKSVVFQTAGLALGGLTIVVTPLISLMKDQIDNLRRIHIPAVCFHSGMTPVEIRVGWEKLVNNRAHFLYTSPERLKSERFIQEIRNLDVRLLVVDEAHCISQWGYDFRPSFMEIAKLRKIFPGVPVLALTATATPEVAADIRRQLGFREGHHTFQMSFQRRNIGYLVKESESKMYDVSMILQRTSGSAIVYVRNRKRTKEIADYLQTTGITASYYHAGLERDVKEERQNLWKSGEIRVIVATNAFGMGIDKPDVRTVIHYDMPPSLEEYYQEAGRAGRDGANSFAILLYSRSDKATLRRRVSVEFPDKGVIRKVYERVCNYLDIAVGEGYNRLYEFDMDLFCRTFRMQEEQVRASLRILGRGGYLEYIDETDNRSRVMMIMTREELYHLPDMSATAERVLSAVFRNYTGLFSDYVYIHEEKISRLLGISEREIYESMLELSRLRVLHYVPRRQTPYIYISTSREEPRYLVIGRDIYEERRQRMERRVESMIDYADDCGSCRVRRMLEYFGEPDAEDCGGCDVCRSAKPRRKMSDKELRNSVRSFLGECPYGANVHQIEMRFADDPERAVMAARYLCETEEAELSGMTVRLRRD